MITSDQIRAARALLNWSQTELSVRSGLTTPTIANIELGKQTPSSTTLQRIHDAFEIAGIEFLENDGVRKRAGKMYTYSGREGFNKFYQDIDATCIAMGTGEFLVSNVDERDFLSRLGEEATYHHYKAINQTSITYRILIVEGDNYMPGKNFNAEYRWTPDDQFYSVPFYVYGNKVAYISFEENDVNVFVVENAFLTNLCRRQFNEMWDRALIPNVQGDKSFLPQHNPHPIKHKTVSNSAIPKKTKVTKKSKQSSLK